MSTTTQKTTAAANGKAKDPAIAAAAAKANADADEVERQRKQREANDQSLAELEAEREKLAAEQAATGEDDDGQLFVLEQGSRVTLGTLIKRGTPIKYEFKLGGKAIKGAGDMGLVSFSDPELMLLVPARAGKVEVDPTYDGEGAVKHVTVRAHAKPITVYDAQSEAAKVALRGE